MKMNYLEIVNRNAVLAEVGRKTLPRRITYAITKNLKTLGKEVDFYNTQRKDIADRYAAKKEDGAFIYDKAENGDTVFTFASPEDRELFTLEASDLEKTETDVDVVKFKAEELDRCDMSERYGVLSSLEEIALEWMIDYGEDPEA